jgi:hypothetical protein
MLVSNIAVVLRNWQNALLTKYSGLHIAYAESLSYKEGEVDIRSQNLVFDKDNPSFQAFVYNRSKPLSWATTHRAAKTGGYEYDSVNDIVKLYDSWYGEIDINFVFVSPAPQYLDIFEITYHAENGISDIDKFYVDLTKTYNLGVWEYQCIWNTELSNLDIKYGDMYYKAVGGSLKIDGIYNIYTVDTGRIEKINLDIFSYDGLTVDPTNPKLGETIIT